MANDVTLFVGGGDLALPEHLRGIELDEQTKRLAGGTGGPRISIKGGVFRRLENGEEVARIEDRKLNAIIVAVAPDNARTYYDEGYVEGEKKAPTCSSANGKVPDAAVKNKQSAACATCPQNAAGSGENGGRACRYSRSLALWLEGDAQQKIHKLTLPSQSIFGNVENGVMPLMAYAKLLVSKNVPYNAVVTELRFDTNSATPKLGFKAVRYLGVEEYAAAKRLGATPEAMEAIAAGTFEYDGAGAAATGSAQQTEPDKKGAVEQDQKPVSAGGAAEEPGVGDKGRSRKKAPAQARAAEANSGSDTGADRAVAPTKSVDQRSAAQDQAAIIAALQAQLAALQAGPAPVVERTQQESRPLPQSAADVMAQWGDE